jgi:hypothetical protein
MIDLIKRRWRPLAAARPGFRFRERYLARKRARSGRSVWSRAFAVAGGAALVLLSALFGWLPVLGWGTVVLGLGMIAGEFYPAARLMDRLEVGSRRLFRPLVAIPHGAPVIRCRYTLVGWSRAAA